MMLQIPRMHLISRTMDPTTEQGIAFYGLLYRSNVAFSCNEDGTFHIHKNRFGLAGQNITQAQLDQLAIEDRESTIVWQNSNLLTRYPSPRCINNSRRTSQPNVLIIP